MTKQTLSILFLAATAYANCFVNSPGQGTTLTSGSIEFAAMAGAAKPSNESTAGVSNQLELAGSFRDCYAIFLGWTRVPEYARDSDVSAQERQRYEMLHFGLQRQIYLWSPKIGRFKFEIFPYALGGFGFHNSDLVTKGVSTAFNERFAWQRTVVYGGGVRLYGSTEGLWGLRLEYRGFLPIAPRYDFGIHHTFSAGIAIRRGHRN